MTKLVKKKRSPSGSQDLGSKNAVAWSVEFLNDSVRGEFRALDVDVKAGMAYVMNLMVEVGITGVGGPHVGHLRGKVWEIRAEGKKTVGKGTVLYPTRQASDHPALFREENEQDSAP